MNAVPISTVKDFLLKMTLQNISMGLINSSAKMKVILLKINESQLSPIF